MLIVIPKEIHPGERRVAATPQTVLRLKRLGLDVRVQSGAGAEAGFSDSEYAEAGAVIASEVRDLWTAADIVMKVRPPEEHPTLGAHEADLLPENGKLVGFIWPAQHKGLLDRLAARRVTTLAMDCVPRISRAQKMDALSAMANIAGYRAIIEAAAHFPRFFGGQITAAGKVDPAKVLVIGAGVAGLAAVGAARGLGAIVRAFDPRPATKDQVKSLGAEFLEVTVKEEGEGAGGYAKTMSDAFIQAEMALFAAQAMEVDIIVTTALVPGKKAPRLITAGMVESMKPGSVIVDLAADQGGNCALTQPGAVVVHKGVSIIGYTDLPSRMPSLSSQLFGSTAAALVEAIVQGGAIRIDLEDEVVRGSLVTHNGEVTWPPPAVPVRALPPPPEPGVSSADVLLPTPSGHASSAAKVTKTNDKSWMLWIGLAGLAMVGIGLTAPASFLTHLTVFVLACFVGWQVVWSVKPALHTPLMGVTNAVSGIILIGGMLQLGGSPGSATTLLGALAVLIATVNIAGGFLVTGRMLAMFRK